MELSSDSQTISLIACLEFRIEFMCCLEKCHVQRPAIALEAMPQRCQATVCIHPLAEVGEDLFAGLLSMQCLKLGPFFRLCFTDECKHASERLPVRDQSRPDPQLHSLWPRGEPR